MGSTSNHLLHCLSYSLTLSLSLSLSLSTTLRGLGDLRVAPLIKIVDQLPDISSINLRDNRLTDEVLYCITREVELWRNSAMFDEKVAMLVLKCVEVRHWTDFNSSSESVTQHKTKKMSVMKGRRWDDIIWHVGRQQGALNRMWYHFEWFSHHDIEGAL